MFNTSNTQMGMLSSYCGGSNNSYFMVDIRFTRMNDILPTTSISEGTSNLGFATKVDNEKGEENEEVDEDEEIDNDPIEVVRLDGEKITVISEPDPIPTKLEDGISDSGAVGIAR